MIFFSSGNFHGHLHSLLIRDENNLKCLPSLITRRVNAALLTGLQTSPVLVIPTYTQSLRQPKTSLSNPYSDLLYRYLPCLHNQIILADLKIKDFLTR